MNSTRIIAAAAAPLALGLAACAADPGLESGAGVHSGTPLIGELSGEAVEPGMGDPDGSGQLALWADEDLNRLCYSLGTNSVDNATAAHIHRGGPTESGPPVVTLMTPSPEQAEGCVDTDVSLIRQIVANPAGYYVQVHSAAHPQGAIRAQLKRE